MVARYTKFQTEACRAKIRTSHLIRRLQRHIDGKLDLSPTQVRGIEILLSKTLASLSATELTGAVASYVARLPEPAANAAEWLKSLDKPSDSVLLESTTIDDVVSPVLAQGPQDVEDQG